MRSLYNGLAAAAVLAIVTAAPAHAVVVPITEGGGWNTFLFGDVGSDFQDVNGDAIDFTFSLTRSDILRVTDGFFDGDQFDVIINGVDQGPTSTPTFTGSYEGADWTAAFSNPTYSSASYILGPGNYDVTGFVLLSPFFAGQGALAVGGIPEPSTWITMILGLGAVGSGLRRRRMQTAVA